MSFAQRSGAAGDGLTDAYGACRAEFMRLKSSGLTLNMARGKPNAEQLALSDGLLECLRPGETLAEDGTDARNYGGLDGLPEMRRIFGAMLDAPADQVCVGGNSSLNLMFDAIAAFLPALWDKTGARRFICPVPGYDRHFAVCDYFGMEMLPVPMTSDGPDMDAVERAAADPHTVGMWCVPVFSNPTGCTYSADTVRRLASMPAAHPHFRLFWDNAYAVHAFRGPRPIQVPVLEACAAAGIPDRPVVFGSFSKITYAGSAVAATAASPVNLGILRRRLAVQTVGPDKINQLRHARFFGSLSGVLAHMEKLAAVLRPKFELAESVLRARLAGTGASWTVPDGGYFISLDTSDGCAKRTVALCRDAGLALTPAGATFPGGTDPRDRNIRIAPTYPSLEELRQALELFCCAVRLAQLEKQPGTRHE